MKTSKKANADERPEKDEKEAKKNESNCITDEEGSKESSDCDQESDASYQEDKDEEIDKGEMEEEDWIEYTKRSTKEAQEYMTKTKIPCWIETHRRMKWRMAMRIASLPEDGWSIDIIEWNPALDCTIKTNRLVGRPRKRWEDEVNEYLRPEEPEETRGNALKNNNTWKLQATKQRERKEKEEKFAKHRSNKNLGSDELKPEN